MTSNTAPLTGMVAVSGDTEITPLGYVTWFSVPDRPAKLKELEYEWRTAGLPEDSLPPEARPLYLFKRAMRSQHGKVRDEDTGQVQVTDVRLGKEDHDVCEYQISRVVYDAQEHVIHYPKAMRVTFYKARADTDPRPFDFEPLDGVNAAEVLPMMDGITDYFTKEGKKIDGRKIRALVRDYLKSDPDPERKIAGLRGLNMRGKAGGVYFIVAEHKAKLDAIAKVLDTIYRGDAYLDMVPMVDGASERELVRRKHVANVLDEAKEAMSEVADIMRGRTTPVRADVAQHHWRRLALLRERGAEYDALLKSEQSEVEDAMDMLKKQLERFV